MDASAFTRAFNLQRLKSQICFIYLTEGCVLAVEENSIYCWRDLNRLQKDVAFLEDDFS